jgi:YggT family protein
MQQLLIDALRLYVFVIFINIVLSWFPQRPGTLLYSIYQFTRSLTEPVLAPIRRVLPPAGMFDLSPMVLLIAIFFLQTLIAGS